MKLVSLRIKASGAVTVGAVIGEAYLDLHTASGGELPATMIPSLHNGSPPVICQGPLRPTFLDSRSTEPGSDSVRHCYQPPCQTEFWRNLCVWRDSGNTPADSQGRVPVYCYVIRFTVCDLSALKSMRLQ